MSLFIYINQVVKSDVNILFIYIIELYTVSKVLYNINIGDSMKKGTGKGIIQLGLSILIMVLFQMFYFKVLSLVGLKLEGMAYEIADLIRYVLVAMIVVIIYHGNIKTGRSKFNKTFLNSAIYAIACFIVLVLITIGIHELLNRFAHVAIGYSFTNYFSQTFSVGLIFRLIKEVIIIPFLLCIIFPLGFSNIIKNSFGASLIAGLTYGIINALGLHVDLETAIYCSITPALVVFSLTYLYKANNNIWSVYVTYILYVLCGTFAIGYLVR